MWEAHRRWLHATDLPHEWRMRMRRVSERSAKRNVCTYLRNRRTGGTAAAAGSRLPRPCLRSTRTAPWGRSTPRPTVAQEGRLTWRAGVSEWPTRYHFDGMLGKVTERSVDGRALLELDYQALAGDYGLSSRLHRKRFELELQAARERGNGCNQGLPAVPETE